MHLRAGDTLFEEGELGTSLYVIASGELEVVVGGQRVALMGEREVVASLNAWARRGRSLQLLARDYSLLRLQHPRFVQWRTTWSHLVEAQGCASASADELPSVLWSPGWTLQRLDTVRCTMVVSRDAERRVALQEQLHQWWLKGSSAFPASTLGL